ncbi:Tricorn protease domain-containing protein [Enterovibrio nigricans]|uniref:WD40-like Beta Propeller Repeat n=1 Tax=Enterovibrio nigricans DSM 22720 TaxID=1121868 RepID=A0A1T4VAL0_9GAMM|nr:Tricorn protease domain-containing protein [Enterovibrio nigricans]PKF50041.1 Tricorn protease domain-containing protein [Enterovibrio nigricans]SKA61916.1 hypothetical protein SAMN02745132_03548 [Enterovibrio nigricans DSM 22720]
MKRRPLFGLLAFVMLAGCNNDNPPSSQDVEAAKPEQVQEQVQKKPLTVEERIAEKNAREWPDGRVYITENNYVIYDEKNGRPRHFITKTKEWPREDLSNAASYDLPRLVFRWDNGDGDAEDFYDRKDKVWSIKTDGTDLRVVADEFVGAIRLMRISPNNRYLALAYSKNEGMFKVIKDLKTGEYTELGRSRGYPEFLWAEDSSYLYFTDKFEDWKYTLASKKTEQVETQFNEHSVIFSGQRFVFNEFGVAVYDEKLDKFLYSTGIDVDEDRLSDFEMHKRAIDPTGSYAWGQSNYHRYLIDVKNGTYLSESAERNKIGELSSLEVLSANAKYARTAGGAQVVLLELDDNRKIKNHSIWRQIGTGHSAGESSLYNAFANDGNFVGEAGND